MNKKAIYFLLFSVFTFSLQAQQISDGLRYGTEHNTGTARYTALSGAMGALGGDLSAIKNNPAGSAVFLVSSLGFSGSLSDVQSKTTYYNHYESTYSNDLNLSQLGGVFVFYNPNEESSFQKFTFGVNYDTNRNFDSEIYFAGIGNNSLSNFFLSQAQGINLDLLELQSGETLTRLYQYLGEHYGSRYQNALLGYQGYLFDPADPGNSANTAYISNIAGNEFVQEYLAISRGYNSKFTLNVATQIENNWYVGINLNMHSLYYRQNDYFLEANDNPNSVVNKIGFGNTLRTTGSGISAQIGAIGRIQDNLRLGISLDLPTWFQIDEETSQFLETRRKVNDRNQTVMVNPRVVNVYEEYTLRTPGKIAASAAYVFNQDGLISLEYSFKDYSQTRFSPSRFSHFRNLNQEISNTLTGASSIKAGAEYRINEFSLRGGFHYEESPYKNDDFMGDLIGFSLGAGYSFGNYAIDLAYSRSEQEGKIQPYHTGFTDSANLKTIYSNFILSMSFNF